jgi:SAM-dependent methyltransferase
MRRFQRHLGFYSADDFRADLKGDLCRVITTEKFIARLLDIEDVPIVGQSLPLDCIHYVPSRLTEIHDLITRMDIGGADEFWDIGCGLGGVSMLVAWLTGARVRGVDFHREYCEKATAAARSFSLPGVQFIHADARDADYTSGNKFFMFMPFTHNVQDRVLERLRRVAELHPITIGWQGPRDHLRNHAWLREDRATQREATASHSFSLKVFRSLEVLGRVTP